ncbi:hypothetical protein EIO60_03254|nr:hypothetical protein [Candidatus Pantoea persica]
MQHAEEFIGTRVALRFVEKVAVAPLLTIAAAADDMHRQAAVSQVIEGRQRGRDKARPLRQQKFNREVCAAACAVTKKPLG